MKYLTFTTPHSSQNHSILLCTPSNPAASIFITLRDGVAICRGRTKGVNEVRNSGELRQMYSPHMPVRTFKITFHRVKEQVLSPTPNGSQYVQFLYFDFLRCERLPHNTICVFFIWLQLYLRLNPLNSSHSSAPLYAGVMSEACCETTLHAATANGKPEGRAAIFN